MATATLVNYLPESVVVTHGANKTEFIYGKWDDWNNPLPSGDPALANEVKILAELQFVKPGGETR